MNDATAVAMAFRYPGPGSRDALEQALGSIEGAGAAKSMRSFLDAIGRLSLSEWEELHTITLDLSPLFVPYVGHAVWGENYRRGAFMADLAREMRELDIDLMGELPDHMDPILRYLDGAREPLGDVVEVLPQALMRMRKELAKSDKKNPYRHVLDAAQHVAEAIIDERRKAVT